MQDRNWFDTWADFSLNAWLNEADVPVDEETRRWWLVIFKAGALEALENREALLSEMESRNRD